MLLQAVARPLPKLLDRPSRFGYSDDRHIQIPAADHLLQRGKNLLVGQIAGRAKKDQSV